MAGDACELTYQYDGAVVTGYCVDCPALSAVTAVPAKTLTDPQVGWNSGARSAAINSGDCYVQFSVATPVAGTICGLTDSFADTRPETVAFGFYALTSAGVQKYIVIERGVAVVAAVAANLATAVFRVERRGDRITYFVNNRIVHRSAQRNGGPLMVVGLMYRAQDGIL